MSSLKVISLFSGAGGLDYGFEAAGFETRVAVEMDSEAAATLKANRNFPVLQHDIHTVSSTELLAAASLNVSEADLVLGGPPCQPFSKAGFWASGDTKRLNDPRASTLDEYMRVVDETLPKVFVLENVHGISYTGKEEGLRLLERLVAEINAKRGTDYQLSWQVLNAADYGVPQSRSRFFLVGHREGGKFTFPAPTHTDPATGAANSLFLPANLSPYLTAWDAIGNLEVSPHETLSAGGRWGDLLPSIPEGENYLWHTDRKGGLPLFGW